MEFQGFDSIEEMFEAEKKAQKSAAQRTMDWQLELAKPESYAISMAHGLLLFHKILDPLEGVKDLEERRRIEDLYNSPHMQYYRFTESGSVACPNSEKGDIHVSLIVAIITEECYLAYKEKGFGLPRHYL